MASMRSLGAAALVTAIIGMRVSKHYWQAYDPFDKFFAVFVLLALDVPLPRKLEGNEVRKEEGTIRGIPVDPDGRPALSLTLDDS